MRRRKLLATGSALLAGCVDPGALRSPGNQGGNGLASMSDELDRTSVEVDGDRYGAAPDDGPIGGGAGYDDVVTDGDYRVSDREALESALQAATAGDVVFVEPGTELDLSVWVYTEGLQLSVPDGVTLASNRGVDGAPGALIASDTFDTDPLLTAGSNARITGLRIRGPDSERRMDLHEASFQDPDARGRDFYYSFPKSRGIVANGDGVTVDNCELSGWSHAAVAFGAGEDHRVTHSYIHHNQRHGLGYGVLLDQATVDIEANLFDWNRHSVAGTGRPGSGYAARNNVVLEHANSHLLDMHGGRDRGDGTGIAGEWMEFVDNTLVNVDQPAIVIRGFPTEEAEVTGNWFLDPTVGAQAVVADANTSVFDNAYGDPPELSEEQYPFEPQQ